MHALSAEEFGRLKGEDPWIEESVLARVGGERKPPLTRGMEEGNAAFPSKHNLMRHFKSDAWN